MLEQRFPFSLMRLILPLKFRKESSNQARPPLKLCENDFNTKTVVLIENGADVCLVDNESKERSFVEMIQAGVERNFHNRPGTPHGFALPTT